MKSASNDPVTGHPLRIPIHLEFHDLEIGNINDLKMHESQKGIARFIRDLAALKTAREQGRAILKRRETVVVNPSILDIRMREMV
jgi:hypothetical protein